MATTVQNFGMSEERMSFMGSSEDEMAYAKTFWQSVQLLPPMESRLVSRDISQRLKTAPPGYQTINRIHPENDDDPPVLKKFLRNARTQEYQEQKRKLDRLANFRAVDRQLLQKHRSERKEKEKISDHKGLKDPPPPPEMPIDDPEYFRETEVDMGVSTMKDIELFEKKKGLYETASEKCETEQ